MLLGNHVYSEQIYRSRYLLADQWVSTLHRVVLLDQPHNQRRQSIAYFVNVNGDTPVDTLETCISKEHPKKYPTILARDHLMAKHLASMGVSVEEEKGVKEEL
jgi:isopenicillin N synthase-like dioxygenase